MRIFRNTKIAWYLLIAASVPGVPSPAAPGILLGTYFSTASTNQYSVAQGKLRDAGFLVDLTSAKPASNDWSRRAVIGLIMDAPNSRRMTGADLRTIDDYLRNGGGLLILLGQTRSPEGNPLLRRFRLTAGELAAAAKVQKLAKPVFKDLRFHAPPSFLLDLSEDAFTDPLLIPNDREQPVLGASGRDHAGFRMVLASVGKGRIAFMAGAEAFDNPTLVQGDAPPAHDNGEILLRLCRWLAAGN